MTWAGRIYCLPADMTPIVVMDSSLVLYPRKLIALSYLFGGIHIFTRYLFLINIGRIMIKLHPIIYVALISQSIFVFYFSIYTIIMLVL